MAIVLRRLDDPGHGLDGLHRVVANRGLTGEHDAIRPVKDRVRDVGRLRASGPRRGNHGLQHLSCDDHRFSPLARSADDLLLH